MSPQGIRTEEVKREATALPLGTITSTSKLSNKILLNCVERRYHSQAKISLSIKKKPA